MCGPHTLGQSCCRTDLSSTQAGPGSRPIQFGRGIELQNVKALQEATPRARFRVHQHRMARHQDAPIQCPSDRSVRGPCPRLGRGLAHSQTTNNYRINPGWAPPSRASLQQSPQQTVNGDGPNGRRPEPPANLMAACGNKSTLSDRRYRTPESIPTLFRTMDARYVCSEAPF